MADDMACAGTLRRPPESRPHPLRDQRPFKLSDGGDDREHGLAKRGPGVDRLPQADELDPEVAERVPPERNYQVYRGVLPGGPCDGCTAGAISSRRVRFADDP